MSHPTPNTFPADLAGRLRALADWFLTGCGRESEWGGILPARVGR
jgi:hypothetical protein